LKKPAEIKLSSAQRKLLNKRVYDMGLRVHPLYEGRYRSGKSVRNYLEKDLEWISHFKKYDRLNRRINGPALLHKMKIRMDLKNIPVKIKNRFALVVKRTYLRAFPTTNMIMKKKNDLPFDLMQKSALDTGQELTLFHISADNQWGYVQAPFTTGWVKLKHLAWTYDKKKVASFVNSSNFIIATAPFTPVYKQKRYIRVHTLLRMGSRLPLVREGHYRYYVRIPVKHKKNKLKFKTAVLYKRDNVSAGYLPFTTANIADQAFRMLGMPYSWGGQSFHTDCSSYIMRIFSTVGLQLPRSSVNQVKFFGNHKIKINQKHGLDRLQPFLSLLYLDAPGHIMLYLGRYRDNYYVIHNKWSYHNKNNKKIPIKKIIVSDLQLGKGSRKGSLLTRIKRFGTIHPELK
ncbi:MAG TPA: SH3 domain-containing protein, partial [Spirochaetota bacterium]|nr:SH3 domain-containing protein [Spirochaetota bacterium]